MRSRLWISAACCLLAMTAASLPANADGPKNPRDATNYVHLGNAGGAGHSAEVYYSVSPPPGRTDYALVELWFIYDTEQHTGEGDYYQRSEPAVRIWCDDKASDVNAPNQHFFYWNEDGSKLLFTRPDHYDAAREALPVTPEPIPAGTVVEAVYNAICH